MSQLSDRYATVGRRDFAVAIEHLLETEFKLVGSHRVIRMIAQSVIELHQEFYPEIREMDLNPVIVHERGLTVVDVRIILKKDKK